MKRAGDVVRSAQGLAIVRCVDENHPDMGAEVVDERLSDVGRVVDVFGPVEKPYLAVSPDEASPASLLGSKVYVR
ncbi:H/ACA ribonucleoprotein complex subunit GAR1 [Halarchaeum sp. P4]|uniref:H/ACA ribonucleoprotein complex subunit GAR1 n=1 Tax=Halarchaeum sp. P4 TaxID=3421639 RepID=UPI003EBA41DC